TYEPFTTWTVVSKGFEGLSDLTDTVAVFTTAPFSSYTLPRRVVGVRFEGEGTTVGVSVGASEGVVVGASVGAVVGAVEAPVPGVGAPGLGQPVSIASDRV